MKTRNKHTYQQGFVSIFTVIFFVILITVLTVGFLRIVVRDQDQSINNSLTETALDAAKAGIEDGKRALLAYNDSSTPASVKTALGLAFQQQQCNSLTGNPTITSALGIDPNGNVAGSTNLNERYSCLLVSPESPDYVGGTNASQSIVVPLKAAGSFTQIQFMWHDNAKDGNVGFPISTPVGGFPTQAAWNSAKSSQKTAEYMRLELIETPPDGSITPSSITSSAMYLTPTSLGSAVAGFGLPQPNIGTVFCKTTAASQYACSATIPLSSGATQQYLRVTPLYGATHFMVCLQSCTSPVNFDGAQPIIDSTGQVTNVFRRVQARVTVVPKTSLPEYSLESAQEICKAFQVGSKINTGNGDSAGCPVL